MFTKIAEKEGRKIFIGLAVKKCVCDVTRDWVLSFSATWGKKCFLHFLCTFVFVT